MQDTYFHVPMNWEFHKFPVVKIENRILYFSCSLSVSLQIPELFIRVVKPINSWLLTLKCLFSNYLDDFILFAETAVLLSESAKTTLVLRQSLDFAINWENSSLNPAQHVEFLGVSWDPKNGPCQLRRNENFSSLTGRQS